MSAFRADERAYHQSEQCLDKNRKIKIAVQEITQSAGSRCRQDDKHAGANGLQKRYTEDDQQCNLDECRRADTESTGQKAVDYTRDDAVDIKFPAGKLFMTDVNMPVHKFRLIDFYI